MAHISKSGQSYVLSGILNPVNDSDAANKAYVDANSSIITWEDERTDTDYMANTFEVASDTGLELVMEGSKVVLQQYVAPSDLAISITGAQGNLSFFNDATTDTASVEATSGTLTRLDTATVTGGTATISGLNVTYNVVVTPGIKTLAVTGTGSNSDGSESQQSASTNHRWTVYRDYWLQINQSSDTEAFDNTVGRNASDYSHRALVCRGHTFFVVSADAYPNAMQFTTALGTLTVNTPDPEDITVNGVTKSYRRYYLGNFGANTNVTTSGGT